MCRRPSKPKWRIALGCGLFRRCSNHGRRRLPFIQNRPRLLPFFNLSLLGSSAGKVAGFAAEWRQRRGRRMVGACSKLRSPSIPSTRSSGIIWFPDSHAYLTRWRSSQPLSSHASARVRPSSSSWRTPRPRQRRLGPGSTASLGLPPRCASAYSPHISESIAVRAG